MVALALFAGASSFLTGAMLLLALPVVASDGQERLFQLNTIVGSALVLLVFGTFLVFHAASSLGRVASRAMGHHMPWFLLLAFPLLVGAGQWLVLNPGSAPWLFPFVNAGIVAIPSVLIALAVTRRYRDRNPWSWPVTWREWVGAFGYGAIGAVMIAAIINTGYLTGAGWLLLRWYDIDVGADVLRGLPDLPRNAGVLFDLSALSVVAPLNEEFFKGFIVALFWWRGGSVARCFAWGVLAGTGFNLVETFINSLALVDAGSPAADNASHWWIFGPARAGTAALHGLAAGFAALAFYGLFTRQWRFLLGYPLAVVLHGNWNAAVYLIAGSAVLSQAGPDSAVFALIGIALLVTLAVVSVALLWTISGQLRDRQPASIYRVLGMEPAGRTTAPGVPLWLGDRMKPVRQAPA